MTYRLLHAGTAAAWLLLLGTSVADAASVSPARAADTRASLLAATEARGPLLDCQAPVSANKALAKPQARRLFEIQRDELVTPLDDKEYTAAVWSPTGDAVVFVAPTNEIRQLEGARLADPSVERPFAVSKNELWFYGIEDHTWTRITEDGSSPVFSEDGETLYFMSGAEHIVMDTRDFRWAPTGLESPVTDAVLFFAQPTARGLVVSPERIAEPVKVLGTASKAMGARLAFSDTFVASPDGRSLLVSYSADGDTPPFSVLHRADGSVLPLFKNCPYSGHQLAWNPSREIVAYPVLGPRSEIRVKDTASGAERAVLGLDQADKIHGLSLSADGEYLAFSQGDHREGSSRLGVLALDGSGMQWLTEGLMAQWSPDGSRLLYAVIGASTRLEWRLMTLR